MFYSTNLACFYSLSQRAIYISFLLLVYSLQLPASAKLDPELRATLDRIASLRVELSADLLFAALDSGKLPREAAVEYLPRLFHRATEARRHFPETLVPRNEKNNKATQFRELLSNFTVDRTSIQLRVLKRLLRYDSAAARDLAMYLLNSAPPVNADCSELEIPILGHTFYATLLEVGAEPFMSSALQASAPQQAASLVSVLPSLSTELIPTALSGIIQGLSRTDCSDRVYTATELKLGLGQNIEKILQDKLLSPEMATNLAVAYLQYVNRQWDNERCADVGSSYYEALIGPARRISSTYDLSYKDRSHSQLRYSTAKIPQQSAMDLEATRRIFLLAAKLKQGGSSDIESKFETEVKSYVAQPPRLDTTVFDLCVRASTLMEVAASLGNDKASRLPLEEAFRIVENSPTLKDFEPAAWVFSIRQMLNLSKHPNVNLAKYVADRLNRSRDAEVSAYVEVDGLIGGIIREYQEQATAVPPGLMANE